MTIYFFVVADTETEPKRRNARNNQTKPFKDLVPNRTKPIQTAFVEGKISRKSQAYAMTGVCVRA